MTIIYPNNGNATNLPTIGLGETYIMDNPFPNKIVQCQVELYDGKNWIPQIWHDSVGATSYSTGARAFQVDEKIVLKTGNVNYLLDTVRHTTVSTYNPYNSEGVELLKAPARIRVFAIANM